jgi:hypothetical protein
MGGTPHTPDGFVAPRDLARQLGMSKGLLDGFVRRGDLHVTRCGRWRLIPLAEAAAFTAWIARQMPPPDRPRGAYCRDVPGGAGGGGRGRGPRPTTQRRRGHVA